MPRPLRSHFSFRLLPRGCISLALITGCASSAVSPNGAAGGDTGGAGGALGTGGASGGALPGGASSSGGTCIAPSTDSKYPKLAECGTASVDRLQKWWGTGEGPTIPGDGESFLTMDECGPVAKVEFASAPNWHVAPVWIANAFVGVDVSNATEIRLEYSATSNFFVQLRPFSTYSGGSKWHHPLPSTNGEVQVVTIPLTEEAWVEKLGPPPTTVAEALQDLCGLVFVGTTNNKIMIKSLRIEGYEPPCL